MLHAIKRTWKQYSEGRSSKWPKVRKAWLKEHPTCAACGGKSQLEVHHLIPFSWPGGRQAELDTGNLITLCEAAGRECHLRFGHLGDFRSVNSRCVEDSRIWRDKYQTRPYLEDFINDEIDA